MRPNKKEQRHKELLGMFRKLNALATQRFQPHHVNSDLDSQISYLQRKLDLTHAWPIISRLSGRKVAHRDDRRQKLIDRAIAREA